MSVGWTMIALLAISAGGSEEKMVCPACYELPRSRPTRRLRWLHIPKCGTPFQHTIFNWACPRLGAHNGGYMHLYTGAAGRGLGASMNRSLCDSDVDRTLPGHRPLPLDAKVAARTVTLFRSPAQRLLSGFKDRRHSDGFQASDRGPDWLDLTPAGYARHRGIAGCYTRMLQNAKCACAAQCDPAHYRAEVAVSRVASLGFVGLLEHWHDSVCLFHAVFGGEPVKAEFRLAHSTRTRTRGVNPDVATIPPHNETLLEGFVDHDDELVYAAARRAFMKSMKRHAPNCAAERFADFEP